MTDVCVVQYGTALSGYGLDVGVKILANSYVRAIQTECRMITVEEHPP